MNYLSIPENDLKSLGGLDTAREIMQQPKIWLKIFDLVKKNSGEIKEFINEAISAVDDIILTGAGTSAYIGECLISDYKKNLSFSTRAIPTTDIVSHPENFFLKERKVLLISFARSGNSPESCATTDLAEKYSNRTYHLVITCNKNGELNKNKKANQYTIVLPEETNDASLAMTSSFTGMLLTGLLVSRIFDIENQEKNIQAIVNYGNIVLNKYLSSIREIAKKNFQRAVFLGSGPLFGTSIESHLKLQELTDGKIICKNESYLGFRHGPKAVINDKTIVVFLLSSNNSAYRYERDLVKTIKKEAIALSLIGVSETLQDELNLDTNIVFSENNDSVLDESYLTVCGVLPAQILGFFKSIDLGLKPDNPSVMGTISRVVEGVTIYK